MSKDQKPNEDGRRRRNNSRNNSNNKGRKFSSRRENYVDNFRWGFVEGTEGDDTDGGRADAGLDDDLYVPEPEETEPRPADKNRRNNRGHDERQHKSSDPKSGSHPAKPAKSVTKHASRPVETAMPLFEEDDDDLNLPSYGRTPIPTDAELPKPPRSQSRSQSKPAQKSSPREQSSARPEVEAVVDAKSDYGVERGTKPRREQMVWDPEKREYVPLVVPEPKTRRNRKGRSEQPRENPSENRVENRNDDRYVERETESGPRKTARPRRARAAVQNAPEKSVSEKPAVKKTEPPKQQDARRETPERVGKEYGAVGADNTGRNTAVNVSEEPQSDLKHARKKSHRNSPEPQTASGAQEDRAFVPKKKARRRGKDTGTVEPVAETQSDFAAEKPRDKRESRPPMRSSAPQRGDVAPPPVKNHKPNPADIEAEAKGFAKLGVSETMLEALKTIRFIEPTPIQAGVFKQVQAGKDVMGQAQTGTGKTAAFSIPIIEGVEECPPGNDPVALILVPTRELAVQVRDETQRLCYGRDVRVSACYGGKPIAKQISRLREGVDIVVGTPGRVLDLMNRSALKFDSLRWVVLDEADRMLDIGFRPDIEKILKRTPQDRQTLLFSATLPAPVVRLAEKYMKSPEVLDFSNKNMSVDTIEQYYVTVDPERKFDALLFLLEEQQPHQAIIFARTKRGVDRLARLLSKRMDGLAAIHGDLNQGERDRVMANFRSGKLRYLVATDVVGRGIDVSGISHIINYDIPAFCDDYVHRVGRTGRMGREGVAFTFVTVEEGSELTRIEMRIDKLLKRAELKGFESYTKPGDPNANIDDLTSDAPSVEAKPVYGKPVRKVRRAL